MVDEALKMASKIEKEAEHIVYESCDGSSSETVAEETLNEFRRLAESVTSSALKAAEDWGKSALEKCNNIEEEIIC